MISFDIFDTLITRKTFSPQGIFLLVQQRLFSELDAAQQHFCNNFFTLRIGAEKDARLYAKQEEREEITLDEIYDVLVQRTNISRELANCIKEWEIQAEMDHTYPIRNNIELLKNYYSKGEHVVLISDMYLKKEDIRKILIKHDVIFSHIPIYVSSEIKKTKQSGSLYFEVSKRENANFSNWIHYGDNRSSDYLLPQMLGIDARHIPLKGLTSWENELGKSLNLNNNLVLQFYFGMARNIRLEKELSQEGLIGASVGGMILYPYVLWIVRKSIEMGIKHLYFIARDGYILKKIADFIIKNQNLTIHTTYIYGSRKTWRISEVSEADKQKIIMYLSQEVDFSDPDFAFVDLNGTGYTMECLSDVILEHFGRKTTVFYFDLLNNKKKDSYMFIPFCSECSGLIELFGRAPHGATIGYEQRDTKIVPKLQPISKTYWERAGLYDYIEGVELFADKVSQCDWECWMEDIRLVEAVLEYCKERPCQELQDFMGKIPHCNGVEEEKIEYAPVLSVYDIFKLYMWRTDEDISQYYSGVNLNLSLMRTSCKYKKEKFFLERHYNRALGRCIHWIKNRRKKIREDSRQEVIIYGAGNVGKRLYEHLKTISGVQVAAWVDMDYEKYQKTGYPVISLRKALMIDFSYIIIAMAELASCKQIKQLLIDLGIESQKIVSYKEFLEEYMI